MLYSLTSQGWTGRGEIVEIGSLFGKSTVCLARGMADNPNEKIGKLHAFDKWKEDGESGYMFATFPDKYRGSFRHLFDQNTEEVKEWIIPHQGDVSKHEWCGKLIEILFLDCSVSREFHEAIFSKFFPFLRPGSILIHQDYFFYRSYYLPLMMAKLSPYIEERRSCDTSMVYEVVKKVPDNLFENQLTDNDDDIVWSLEKLTEVYGQKTTHGAIVSTMLMYFHTLRGERDKAETVAKAVEDTGITEKITSPVIPNMRNAMAGV